MKVWVAVHNNADSIDVGVYESETAAYAGMAKLIRDFGWWKEAFEIDHRNYDLLKGTACEEDYKLLPESPPENDRECVEEYFNVMSAADGSHYESLQIDQFTVKSLDEIHGVIK